MSSILQSGPVGVDPADHTPGSHITASIAPVPSVSTVTAHTDEKQPATMMTQNVDHEDDPSTPSSTTGGGESMTPTVNPATLRLKMSQIPATQKVSLVPPVVTSIGHAAAPVSNLVPPVLPSSNYHLHTPPPPLGPGVDPCMPSPALSTATSESDYASTSSAYDSADDAASDSVGGASPMRLRGVGGGRDKGLNFADAAVAAEGFNGASPSPPRFNLDGLKLSDGEDVAPGASTPVVPKKKKKTNLSAKPVLAGEFEAERHFYPRVLNAHIHPLVSSFFSLGNERILARYTHLNPQVNYETIKTLLAYRPKYFQWAGSDLFNVTTSSGQRQMIIVETNSCPSGQKSMPLLSELGDDHGGYGVVIDMTFKEMIDAVDPSLGGLAVVYDKNLMEASGYAAVMADSTREKVWLVAFYDEDPDPPVRWEDGVMMIRDNNKEWHAIRACFRYVTQKPWNRFPINAKTLVLNSIVSCLAGGRNKMMAARAYDFLNAELDGSGLSVRIPETIRNVTKSEIPLWLDSMGGHAVLKVPYSNAGQGVYTITNKEELRQFMEKDHHYDKFIVQSLVGNASWSSVTRTGKYYHVGTIPNKKNHTFVSDLRMMVSANKDGFRPVAIYARRARKPLLRHLEDNPEITSWEMLGTNLSVKVDDEWTTEAQRLLLMDRKDFNQLGFGIDDLIDAYIQTVLSVIAIDKMAQRLMKCTGKDAAGDPRYPWFNKSAFDFELFEALNPDVALLQEIMH
ncbi:hypothetical protein HK101_011373 [Irineochytrium annulatum]|nr:hypothetical protein HK101_011373 [Irineochytrium annulatum]